MLQTNYYYLFPSLFQIEKKIDKRKINKVLNRKRVQGACTALPAGSSSCSLPWGSASTRGFVGGFHEQHPWALCFVMGSVTQVFFQKNSGGSLTMVETSVMILVSTLDPCLTLGTAGSESWVAASPNLYTVSLIFALNSTHTFVFNPFIKSSLGHCYSSSNVSCWDSDGTCSYMIPHALLLFSDPWNLHLVLAYMAIPSVLTWASEGNNLPIEWNLPSSVGVPLTENISIQQQL